MARSLGGLDPQGMNTAVLERDSESWVGGGQGGGGGKVKGTEFL